jgi:DNA-binding IclR family transcriptional regulator
VVEILAYLPKAQVVMIVHRSSASRLSGRAFEKFLRELEQIRLDGFALDIEESEPGLCCVGAPVFDRSGKPLASISISGSTGALAPRSGSVDGEDCGIARLASSDRLQWRVEKRGGCGGRLQQQVCPRIR